MSFRSTFAAAFVILASSAPAADRLEAVGVTHPYRNETLSVLVPGKITAIHVDEGDRVEKGALVVELDRRGEELEVSRRKLVLDSKVELNAATTRVQTLARNLADTRRLYEKTKSVSREELSKLELEHSLALAEVEAAQLQESREQIEFEMARFELSQRTLHSPLGGIVTERLRHVGETCQPHEPLLRIIDISRCYFITHVPAAVAAKLRVGVTLPLTFTATGTTTNVTGEISFISPTADPASGLQEIRLLFDNPGEKIPAGIDGNVTILAATRTP